MRQACIVCRSWSEIANQRRRDNDEKTGGLATVPLCGSVGCFGGGEIVGIGNSGNRTTGAGELMEDVADALAANRSTPRITDEMLVEIFSAILGRASRGDPGAALVVLQVAQQQRADDG